MWKQAAASMQAYAAAAFDRRTLKPGKTKICASVEVPPEGFGRVKQDGKPLHPPSVASTKDLANEGGQGMDDGSIQDTVLCHVCCCVLL